MYELTQNQIQQLAMELYDVIINDIKEENQPIDRVEINKNIKENSIEIQGGIQYENRSLY